MKLVLSISILLINYNILIANDGVFYARGNTLIPLEETTIELKKELLTLNSHHGNTISVDVHFEFYNPGEAIEKLVGFVTPPASGVISEEETLHPEIRNFEVLINNNSIDFKVARIDTSGFNSIFEKKKGKDFIYYFKVKFKKGINIIEHSYWYEGGISSHPAAPGPFYHYRLTTGKSWANKQIDDFELRIFMEDNTYFSVPSMFSNNKLIDWKIQGEGKIGNVAYKGKMRNIYLKTGYIIFKTTDFQPEFDLSININNPYADIIEFGDFYFNGIYSEPREINDLSNDELRILRNTFYAIHGYRFKSDDLYDYFQNFDWYYPDPSLKSEDIQLEYWEKKIVDNVLDEENNRKLN